jgi:hypothetical protein
LDLGFVRLYIARDSGRDWAGIGKGQHESDIILDIYQKKIAATRIEKNSDAEGQ